MVEIPFGSLLYWLLPFVLVLIVFVAAFRFGVISGQETLHGADYKRWPKPVIGDGLHEEAVKLMQVAHICPFCLADLLAGPGSRMSRNFYCTDPRCNSRFNILDLPPEHPQWKPWGQYLGPLPDDVLIDLRLRQMEAAVRETINDDEKKPTN